MKSILYIIALILVGLWALVYFTYHVGSALVHLLLVVGIVVLLFNVFNKKRPM